MRTSFSQPLASALLVFGLLAATDRVRAELEPSELIFDVAEDVPDEDLQTIKSGIEIVRIYIQEFLGGDIPTEIRSTTTVKVVATGLGNQEPGGGGACCTAFSEENPSGVRLFFDVLHPQWILAGGPGKVIDGVFVTDRDKNRLQRGAHEYAHAWQNSIGCISLHDQRMGFWLNEGIAEYAPLPRPRRTPGANPGRHSWRDSAERSPRRRPPHQASPRRPSAPRPGSLEPGPDRGRSAGHRGR